MGSEEIIAAIDAMKKNKSPKSDGFMATYYKKFKEELAPVLKDLKAVVIQSKSISKTCAEDPTNIRNYLPISLLNKDYKIFARILASSLKLLLVEFIKEDQTGFLPNRQLQDNVRMILNTIENPGKEVCWFFVDTEKAFDNLSWDFMLSVMEKLELGSFICGVVKAIYQYQMVAIQINDDITNNFKVS